MARITRKQAVIFNNHMKAMKNNYKDCKDVDLSGITGNDSKAIRTALKNHLEKGGIAVGLFKQLWEDPNIVSMTSQLMVSMFEVQSKTATLSVKREFKRYLNIMEIK